MQEKELDKLKKMADSGSAAHQHKYAKILFWGQFIEKDISMAEKYYSLAADQGYELAVKGLKRLKEMH